jgi:SCY1-like protein 2
MLLYVITAFLVLRALLSRSKVQERALGVVPGLCESIDYAEVQSVLFPRVAVRFSKWFP